MIYNRSMATTYDELNTLYTQLPSGAPLTSAALTALGISADLAVHYVRGWLTRLARGVYCRKGGRSLAESKLATARATDRRTARRRQVTLAWYGVTHYVSQHSTLHLYGWAAARLPGWFIGRFSAEYHRKRLFDERPPEMMNVIPFERLVDAPLVSAPDARFLGIVERSRSPAASAGSTRVGGKHVHLAHRCTGRFTEAVFERKTVRLCLRFGRERFSLPVGLEVDSCSATDWQQSCLGLAVQRRSIGAQAVNQFYVDAARLLIQVAPVVFESGVFALKGGTAINLFVRDMPRLSVNLDLVFPITRFLEIRRWLRSMKPFTRLQHA